MKHKLTEGPLGFPVRQDLAKSLETLVKSLPKEKAYEYRKVKAVPESVELVQGERADISVITTDSVDGEYEVVLPKGISLEWFLRNPIVTFAHKYNELPVGRAQWVKSVGNGLKAKTVYAHRPESWEGQWLPDAIWSMTQQGILKGKSVGFLPTKIRSPLPEELERRPDWKNCNLVIESAILLEYAVAPIPVNQDSLVEAVAKGYADEATLRRLGLPMPQKIDEGELLLKALEKIDEKRIAKQVEEILRNRGRV